jgi:two-component system, OmpR family, sensor histidine kinase KdpD
MSSLPRRRQRTVAAVALPILIPGAITLVAALPSEVTTASAALLYVLGVVVVTAAVGAVAGLVASALSFVALNFYFTAPVHTFAVDKTQDLIALVVFLLVSGVVGALLSTALAQRSRAERRDAESRLLNHLTTRLLTGEPVERVLERFADAIVDTSEIARCVISTEVTTDTIDVGRAAADAQAEVFSMRAEGSDVGSITVYPSEDGAVRPEARGLVEVFAGQMALALQGMRLSAEASDARLEADSAASRAALFSSVTHDLRTPLASITASVTSLLDEDTEFAPEDRRELLDTIRHEAARLNRLVANLLDLSRMRAGALVPSKEVVAIDEVIGGVLSRLAPTLRGHELGVTVRDGVPDIAVDVVQLDQVLTNLLENAAKFSPPGSPITLTVAGWRNGVQVRVADRGPGIPVDERERVFDAFVRGADTSESGSGLGLAIARAIVEAHGGRIWIEEAPGGGSAVVFELPGGAGGDG